MIELTTVDFVVVVVVVVVVAFFSFKCLQIFTGGTEKRILSHFHKKCNKIVYAKGIVHLHTV